MLRVAVLLLVVALVARRVLPRYRVTWALPVALVVVLLLVRTGGWLLGEDG